MRLVSQGYLSINEVRALEELNGIGPDGDKHLVQLNQTTLERLVEGEAEPAAAPEPEPQAEPGDESDSPSNVIRREALEWLRSQRA